MTKKSKNIGKAKSFEEKIIKILSQNANKSFNYKQIAAKLELDDTKSRNEIIKDLKLLAMRLRSGRIALRSRSCSVMPS